MITARLMGGVGNQLFQIATAIALATDNDTDYAFNFGAKCINQGNDPATYRNTIYRNLGDLPRGWIPKKIYKEPSFSYSPIPFSDGMELVGYFQSEKYFSKYWKTISQMVMSDTSSYTEEYANHCSIHVRHGDYLKLPDYHPTLGMDYYNKAIDIARDYGVSKFLVFSDDIGWCLQHFSSPEFTIIERDDYSSLRIMAACGHHIIANSSFSWWGAWLGENGVVIAPQMWLGAKSGADTSDVVPQRWLRI